jgi:ABC-type nitrate/sulfonate/bicarbonate transport system ATPase subunit
VTAALLRAAGLCARRGGAEVLHDVDLAIEPGEVVAVLGPNGAGKSTLLEVLGGVTASAAGTVERAGRVATARQSPDLARRTAQANVELALAWWGVARAERPARARAALQAMGAEHLHDRLATALSGGERRRVHLARAVALRPDVLLLDEPFAGLDARTRADLLGDAAGALRSAAGATVIVVHDRAEAWALADRLLVLLDGRVAAEGRPREILAQPPTPEVARFLGFDGELRDGAEVLLTRPAHVRLDDGGDRRGVVTRLIPLEDGVRVELDLPTGRLSALAAIPGPALGDEVALRVTGGVRYAAGA